ncbi:hypothetical protein BDW59DRAFT_168002 [Aspergillus cavernicola]|uniref:Carrier domain-containing protein n=1 Tax=Aspergillus cavernicola TaxID=176166 RepID=A0ABR4H8F7_9EURO
MVLVAAQQSFSSSSSAGRWALMDIQLPNALTLEVEKDIVTSFYPDAFEITSVQGNSATLHATGHIRVQHNRSDKRSILDGQITPIMNPATKWYEKLEATGLKYDAEWQSISAVSTNPLKNVYRCGLRESPSSKTETEIPPQTHDIFSIVLQTAAVRAQSNNQNTTGGTAALTPTAAAMARFRSIPAGDGDARRAAATDAVAEADLTRIGIDSLIASELHKQVGELFGASVLTGVSTGWVLSGEVAGGDIGDLGLK